MKKTFDFDKLQLYFGEDYQVGNIVIHQPTIGSILEVGEKRFYSSLKLFVTNPTALRLQLWENGIDWNKITDFQLFCMLLRNLQLEDYDSEVLSLLFDNVDFRLFTLEATEGIGDEANIVLKNDEQNIIIDEDAYHEISQYIRTMFNIFPKEESVKGKTTKEWIIDEERQKLKNAENDDKKSSYLLPLVSFYTNHPGTKHSTKSLKDVGIYEFMDSIQQLQKYESAGAVMKGMYSGFVDGSKIKPENYNFMREI